jgi:hypothetical protein
LQGERDSRTGFHGAKGEIFLKKKLRAETIIFLKSTENVECSNALCSWLCVSKKNVHFQDLVQICNIIEKHFIKRKMFWVCKKNRATTPSFSWDYLRFCKVSGEKKGRTMD